MGYPLTLSPSKTGVHSASNQPFSHDRKSLHDAHSLGCAKPIPARIGLIVPNLPIKVHQGKWLGLIILLVLLSGDFAQGQEDDVFNAGPLFDEFDLTLSLGNRKEAVGPFYNDEVSEGHHTWGIPPFYCYADEPATESKEWEVFYPLLTYERFGQQYRWQIFQIFSLTGGGTQTESRRDRITLFPIYFQLRSSDPNQNYTALFPFYGTIKNRMLRDEIKFVMFPAYSETRKADIITENYFYPFVHKRRGDGLTGWQVWPFVGSEHKEVTRQTNGFNEIRTIPGHDKFFAMWPFYFDEKTGIGTENPEWAQGSLPAYSFLRSPKRDVTTVLWPFFSKIEDREKKYRETQAPWPFVVVTRGEGKTCDRIWPFYSKAHTPTLQSDFFFWPIYKYNRVRADPLDRERTRIVFFLYSDLKQKNTETGALMRRVDLWPFFMYRKDYNGNTRFQALALIESYVPGSHKIERDYSPLWSIWRSERNPKTGSSSKSLFWNLYRREVSPTSKKSSLLFGLFQYQSDSAGKRVRLFYIPISKTRPPASGESATEKRTD